jgi:hypothetical protein
MTANNSTAPLAPVPHADLQPVMVVGSTALLGSVFLLDNDGAEVRHGDTIGFSYGIPPVGVRAQVVQRGKSLFALTPGHTPAECSLRSLRRYIGAWYRLPNAETRRGT